MTTARRTGRRPVIPALALAGTLLVAACSPAASPSASQPVASLPAASSPATSPSVEPSASPAAVQFPLTLTDANGNSHTFDQAVTTFGDMWNGGPETLADLGITVTAQAYGSDPTSIFNYPAGPPAQQNLEYDVEKWAAADVDVILTAAPGFPGYDDVVENGVGNVFYLHFPPRDTGSPAGDQGWIENLRLVAQMADRVSEADAAVGRYENFLAELKARAPEDAATTKVLLVAGFDPAVYYLFPRTIALCTTLLEHGLGECVLPAEVADKADENVFEVSAEAILDLDPEWILYVVGDATTRTDPVWSQLAAVKAGQVANQIDDGVNCCSLRAQMWALQSYAHHVWGEAAGVPDPGPKADFDPAASALLGGS
jgi:ABC-type Fe3+-hydroxamate transport system substrate-binding protein